MYIIKHDHPNNHYCKPPYKEQKISHMVIDVIAISYLSTTTIYHCSTHIYTFAVNERVSFYQKNCSIKFEYTTQNPPHIALLQRFHLLFLIMLWMVVIVRQSRTCIRMILMQRNFLTF